MRLEIGEYSICSAPYGFRAKNNELFTVPEEAAIVREVYGMYLSGMGFLKIAQALNRKYGTERSERLLSALLFCGVCGSPFRRKTWTRNGVKKIYWRCLYHMEKGNDACPQSKGIEEHILHAAICRGLTKSIPCENDVRNTVKTLLAYSLSDNRLLLEYQSLDNMINELKAKAETAEKMCLATGGNKDLYIEEIKKCYASIADVRNQMTERKAQIDKSPEYKTELEKIEACISDEEIGFTEYNDEIIRYLVSSITVTEDMKIVITIKGGVKITEPIYA